MRDQIITAAAFGLLACSDARSLDADAGGADAGAADAARDGAGSAVVLTPTYVPAEPIGLSIRLSRVMPAPPASRPCGATEDDSLGHVSEVEYGYDANGYLATESARSGEGELVRDNHFTYDAGGRLLHAEISEYSGAVRVKFDAQFDAAGQLVMTSEDTGADGVPDDVRMVTGRDSLGRPTTIMMTEWNMVTLLGYRYAADGRILDETWDFRANGSIDATRSCVYDDDALVRTCTDTGPSVSDPFTYETTFRTNLEVLSVKTWVESEDAPTFVGTLTYDAAGRVETATLGPSPIRVTFRYECAR